MAVNLAPDQRQAFADALYGGRKIEAIKQLRAMSGLGLKQAKEIIERLEGELRASNPERFKIASSKGGCVSLLLLLFPAAVIVRFLATR